ncbi:MAG: phenylalanine--tRNA ligase subunit alpha [Candidatus Omnitrophota bacterium]|nr:phenylalanine--tRNA ligase subunit alpha [Candidatus Omnitrophota bacterium]
MNTIKTEIDFISKNIEAELVVINSAQGLEELRIKYLGRQGAFAQLTGMIPCLSLPERSRIGQEINTLKKRLLSIIEEKQKTIIIKPAVSDKFICDIGLPAIVQEIGRLHPITKVIDEICAVFNRIGFSVVEGPEIETEYNNFTGLNISLEHPSREAFDTFYLKPQGLKVSRCQEEKLLLRSHTSPVQIRMMSSHKPPLAVIVPGRVYRPDAVDASHSFMFHQIEGFMVDENIRFSDLKGILEVFAKDVFGEDIKMRFRPHFFPFTEPSAEVDISCIICRRKQRTENREQRKHCSVCGGKGWLEILGSGMIHPNVFKNVGYDPKKYTGFAFGMGVERIAMLKYGIDDIRLFFENDLRFLKQF